MGAFAVARRKAISFGAVAAMIVSVVSATVILAPSANADAVDDNRPAVQQRASSNVTADVLPTVQIDNGVVWKQVISGNTVFVGGEFSNARPAGASAGTNLTARGNLLAYNITTGNLIPSWAPSANGPILDMALSSDKNWLFVVGTFTSVSGVKVSNIAKISTSTGAVDSTFHPNMGGTVAAIAISGSTVYIGGYFTAVNGIARGRLAALDTSGVLQSWAPVANERVQSLAVLPDGSKIIASGIFQTMNGVNSYGMAALDPSGNRLPWAVTNTVQAYHIPGNDGSAGFYKVAVDNDSVYAVAWNYNGGGNFEGAVRTDFSGNIVWLEDCVGDTYDATSMNGSLYIVGHQHYCSPVNGWPVYDPWQFQHSTAFTKSVQGVNGHNTIGYYPDTLYNQPAPALINWDPDFVNGKYTGQTQAAWNATSNSQYLIEGGEFPSVNGVAQYGIVRFAVPGIAPSKQGPRGGGASFPVTLTALGSTSVRLSWTTRIDRDDMTLTYKVFRDGAATPIKSFTANSEWWNTPTAGYIDTGLAAGSTHTYKVQAFDADGNYVTSAAQPVTLPTSGGTDSSYDTAVLADGPTSYWPLNEATGKSGIDHVGFNDLTVGANVARGATGPVTGSTASTFDGSASSDTYTGTAVTAPTTFTISAWVKTTGTGKVIGFGNAQTTNSGSYDRQIYINNAGLPVFGTYPGFVSTVTGSAAVNDGQWHLLVGQLGASGQSLWVDGLKVGQSANTGAQGYNGYWRIGGDNLGGWPNVGSAYLNGSIGGVAVFDKVLTRAQIQSEYTASGRTLTVGTAPADRYGQTVFNDGPALYWRLNETSGVTSVDAMGNSASGTYRNGYTLGVPSPVSGSTGTAAAFNGSNGFVASNASYNNPVGFTIEGWFKTPNQYSSGGQIISFGDSQSGSSSNHDRSVYMQQNGTLSFGVWTGQQNLAKSTSAYNDGNWHYVVATQGTDGLKLFVDGRLAGTNGQTSAQGYTGYWRIGGDTGWDNTGYFNGSIDEFAYYDHELTDAQVMAHYQASPAAVNAAPTASFTSSVNGLVASFDGSGSADSDGTLASYSWDFGDGTTDTTSGATPTHAYANVTKAYSVKLTVADNGGATGTVTNPVSVTHVNVAPAATFTSSVNGLVASFDGSGSADSDGTLTSYNWNFGDGTTDTTSGASPTHTYADVTKSYNVTLAVTDNSGATGTASNPVTVNHANVAPTAAFTSSVNGVTGSFDGSGSADSDGTVASYKWDFGDGTAVDTTSGAKPTHPYANVTKTYTVTLTVTDNSGTTGTTTNPVTVTHVNVAPAASFTSSVNGLVASFDGTGSTDSDGTVASYRWDFGDGTTDTTTGATPSHTYANVTKTYSVTLTVTDNVGATGTSTKSVTITPANVAPAASFTSSVNGLVASFDGAGSTDSDGTVASYSWDFGDGTTDTTTGKTPSHTYANVTKTYSVTLTVTDNVGATGTATKPVTVTSSSTATTLASDTFTRTVASGWGTADQGGAWSVTGAASRYGVDGSVGTGVLAAANTNLQAQLSTFSATDVNETADFGLSAAATGGGTTVGLLARRSGTSDYRAKVKFVAGGSVVLSVSRVVSNSETSLGNVTVSGLTYNVGDSLRLRFVVTGGTGGTATMTASVWKVGTTEPSSAQLTKTDTTASLQGAGTVGAVFTTSSTSTGSTTARFDNVKVVAP